MARRKYKEVEFDVVGNKFPNIGYGEIDGRIIEVKNTLEGQKIGCLAKRKRQKYVGININVLEKAPYEIEPDCKDFGYCGGCTYQNITIEKELEIKENNVLDLFKKADISYEKYHGITQSPINSEYRNKMEYSFGDEGKENDFALALGMRKRGNMYEVVTSEKCNIVDADFREILDITLNFFQNANDKVYHKKSHEGVLRHLLVRKSYYTGGIMVALITTSEITADVNEYKEAILNGNYKGQIESLFHIENDNWSDAIKVDKMTKLYGADYITEKLFDLSFKITPFSFFQTNTTGAETLYSTVKKFIGNNGNDKVVFDLYSGTGTIGQIVADKAKEVIGIEIVEEAVESANENAKANGITNAKFLCGDVFEVLDSVEEHPEFIILDPPRDGLSEKALRKICEYDVNSIIYISCKPTSLVRDIPIMAEYGYEVKELELVSIFPRTYHVETVVMISKAES